MIRKYPFQLLQEPSRLHSPIYESLEIEFAHILYNMIIANDFKNILEIGTGQGYSTWWWLQAAKETNGKVTTIDLMNRVTPLMDFLFEPRLLPIEGNSKFILREDFLDKWDFVYIDGGHTYDRCKGDFELSYSNSSDNCIFAFHDTIEYDGVRDAVLDIKNKIDANWIDYPFGKGLSICQKIK